MIEALIAGQRDPGILASLARGRLKNKSEQLVEALTGRFNTHHAFAAHMHLDHIDCLEQRIQSLNRRIDAHFESLPPWIESLSTIPGVSKTVAEIIIAETGGNMTQFPTPAQLASWAGVCPGHNESAGKVKSSHARPGNSHLKGALGIAAMASVRANGTYFQARYKRLTARRGPMRALVAIEHSIITAVWHMLTNGTVFEDLGENHFQRTHESSTRRHAINQLHQLGYKVQLMPLATTP